MIILNSEPPAVCTHEDLPTCGSDPGFESYFTAVLVHQLTTGSSDSELYWPFDTGWSLADYVAFVRNLWRVSAANLVPAPLEVTWSLAAQEQFYLLLSIFSAGRRRRSSPYTLAVVGLTAPAVRFLVAASDGWAVDYYFNQLLCPRVDPLVAVVFLAWLVRRPCSRALLAGAVLGPAALLLVLGFGSVTSVLEVGLAPDVRC
jgi:peptidoglycan/LPS O-acetylase OafA/YrhL